MRYTINQGGPITKMKKTDDKKEMIVARLADHLLAQGMKEASLRKMAASAGTSDRMLLHYFKDKEEMLSAALILVENRLTAMLDSVRSEQMPFQTLLTFLAVMVNDVNVRPYTRLALELAASAAGGDEYCQAIAQDIFASFYGWIESALKVEREEDRERLASLALATIEGFVLLDAVGCSSIVTKATEGLASINLF
jgi:AcrR family transcriptional regulator